MTSIFFEYKPTLENERVRLRLLRADDIEHLLPFSLQERKFNYSLSAVAGKDNLKKCLDTALKA